MPGKVRVVSIDGGAEGGTDFDTVNQVLSFKKAEFFKIMEVVIHDDNKPEDDE